VGRLLDFLVWTSPDTEAPPPLGMQIFMYFPPESFLVRTLPPALIQELNALGIKSSLANQV